MESSNSAAFAHFLQSTVKLDVLERMTTTLDKELADSQRMLADIKTMFDSVSNQTAGPVDNGIRHEDLSNFLEAGEPKLLLPDMEVTNTDIDLEDIIATMKGYAEDLKKKFTLAEFSAATQSLNNQLSELHLEQYATTLDQLGKRLANIKLNKRDELNKRDMELEKKLTQLCQDVALFSQIVEAKTTVCEQNKNWTQSQHDSNTLSYDIIVNKLLAGINEVTYLLQNKN